MEPECEVRDIFVIHVALIALVPNYTEWPHTIVF